MVTGGGTGLGFFTARELAANGADVALASRDEARLSSAAGGVPYLRFLEETGIVRRACSRKDSVEAPPEGDPL